MRLLVLGGGGFLGYHAVAAALAAGHEVTVLSRSGRAPIPGVEVVTGDRTGDLSDLEGGADWDGVLDTFSDPSAVARTASMLSGRVGVYGYVSGMSVYAPDGPDVPDETAPVRRPGDWEDVLQERSVAKLACEEAVRRAFAGPALVVRPGIMVGPRDPTDRFTYWPVRFAAALAGRASRTVLAPGDPDRSVQYTDARDLAAWSVRMLETGSGGVFNGVGPCRPDSAYDVLTASLRAAGGSLDDVELVWVEEEVLADAVADVEEEARPLWFPEPQIPQSAIDSARAAEAGLTFRTAQETAADTFAWVEGEGRLDDLKVTVDPGLEARLTS